MFNILQEWLISKLGVNNCWNLNLNNVGERFKDGVLFARLLQKYQVIPDSYIQDFKKSKCYTVCLRNIKNINLWLKFLNIIIEDDITYEIADGQSLAVTKLLYQLYLRLETSRNSHKHDDNNTMRIKLINNKLTDFCESNRLSILSNQDGKKHKEKILNTTNNKIFNSLKLFCCLNGIEYTAIDVLKSKKNTNNNARKNNTLNFIQYNINYFYDLFMKNLNDKLFTNDYDRKYNEICSSTIFYILNKKEDTVTADTMSYVSFEDIKNENSKFNSMEVESSRTQSSDEYSNINLMIHDTLKDYIQHTGLWSSEYLNIDPYISKPDILSMIVRDVLNFVYGKSEIQFLEIKKSNVTAVIDIINDKRVIQLIKNHLSSKDILSFTANDAITVCLNDYKKEIMISENKNKLYQVLEDYEHRVHKYSNNRKQEKNIDTNNIAVKNKTKSDSIICKSKMIKSVSDINTESIIETDKKLNRNKLTQTPEQIPEPDYSNPILSSLATLGKIIYEKQKKNHDLQIGDLINCIGEFIKKNQGKNGWVLLNFPVQPLQMALLEYKLTGKIPTFGKQICKVTKKKSKIIPEYLDGENISASKNTYLSNCIKIIKHKDEIKNEKWIDFLQFYKQPDCIQVLVTHFNDSKTYHKKAAKELIGLILKEENELETKKIFKSINIFDNGRNDNITESESRGKYQISELSFISNYEETDSIISKEISNQFQLLSTDKGSNLKNYTYKASDLCSMWETMEHNYINQIKELIKFKENFIGKIKMNMDLITNTVNQTMTLNNPSIINLINIYENESQNIVKDNTTHLVDTIFELQTNLWNTIDSQFQQITKFISQLIDNQHTNNTLINIYKQLIEIELKRTTTTLNFLNRYYEDNVINEYKTNEFNFCIDIHKSTDDIEMFQLFCKDIIYKIEKYIEKNYKLIDIIENQKWTQSVQTEENRFVSQVYRIKASMLKDKIYLNDLTKIDHYLEEIRNIYQFKINDINKLCEILKCAENIGKSFKGNINYISGKFYINETSIYELIHNHMFDSRNKFSMKQLKTITNKLLDNVPNFKMTINDLINTLNELSKAQHIYPTNWPIDSQFNNKFCKEILGSNVITIDWRDFVVQCMELPYPNIDQLLIYRNIFQTYDIGDETISVENYMKTKLWFQNESHEYNDTKRLLCDMYQIQNRFNYSSMLLAFCRDEQPWMGLAKSFSLIFGWNPFDVKMLPINQSVYRIYKGSEVDDKDNNSNSHWSELSSELSNEIFILNKNVMIWFLKTILKLYIDSETLNETLLGIINISQIVESIFVHLQTKKKKLMVINLFQNQVMDKLYNTVYKFQIKELSEVAKMIVMTNKLL